MYRLLRPLLFRLDPERAHAVAMRAAGLAQRVGPVATALMGAPDARLRQRLLGIDFPGPVGLAAGFDKSATRAGAWHRLGFGFAEIGSVTALPSAGNPRPRAIRLPDDRGLINRMGLNNDGAAVVSERLSRLRPESRAIPIGVNIAKTHDPGILGEAAIEDFLASVRALAPVADYIALNVSCPNTAEGKTFEDPRALDDLLTRVSAELASVAPDAPWLVKISPPPVQSGGTVSFSLLDEVIEVAATHGAHGIIATNTTSDRVNLSTDPSTLASIGAGGLSGRPLRERALAAVRRIYEQTGGRLPIIGVGGIDSGTAAYERIRAGASLVEVYTGLVYEGPRLAGRIHRDLERFLERDGLADVAAAVGADHR